MEPWVWAAIIIPVALALVGAFWALIRRGMERMEEKVVDHGERIKALETESANAKVELVRLRDMRHDILDQVSHSLAQWYTSILKMIGKQ